MLGRDAQSWHPWVDPVCSHPCSSALSPTPAGEEHLAGTAVAFEETGEPSAPGPGLGLGSRAGAIFNLSLSLREVLGWAAETTLLKTRLKRACEIPGARPGCAPELSDAAEQPGCGRGGPWERPWHSNSSSRVVLLLGASLSCLGPLSGLGFLRWTFFLSAP